MEQERHQSALIRGLEILHPTAVTQVQVTNDVKLSSCHDGYLTRSGPSSPSDGVGRHRASPLLQRRPQQWLQCANPSYGMVAIVHAFLCHLTISSGSICCPSAARYAEHCVKHNGQHKR